MSCVNGNLHNILTKTKQFHHINYVKWELGLSIQKKMCRNYCDVSTANYEHKASRLAPGRDEETRLRREGRNLHVALKFL